MIPEAGISFYDGTQGPRGGSSTFSGTHSDLTGLDYASAGHTGFEPEQTKGNLTATAPLTLSTTRQVIGGAVVLALDAGYVPRERLTAARTYYVRTDGNDSNTGLVDSAGGAFLTLQAAVNAYQALDCNGYNVTIQVGNGTYTAGLDVRNRIGAGDLYITGNPTTPANVLVNVTSASCFLVYGHPPGSTIRISGFKCQTTTSGYGISVGQGSIVQYGAMDFGACASGHIESGYGSTVRCNANYTISGSAPYHFYAQEMGRFYLPTGGGKTVTLTGTPNFSTAFIVVTHIALAYLASITFSGSATGVRYIVNANSVIDTIGGGANYFPGNSAGSAATGGQYI